MFQEKIKTMQAKRDVVKNLRRVVAKGGKIKSFAQQQDSELMPEGNDDEKTVVGTDKKKKKALTHIGCGLFGLLTKIQMDMKTTVNSFEEVSMYNPLADSEQTIDTILSDYNFDL